MVRGVDGEPNAPAAPPADLRPDTTYSDVYINDSFEASDAIARARVFADRHRWSEAAQTLQRISDKAGDKLVRVEPGYYVGLRERVNRIIAAWEPEGLEVYRALFEREISEGLSSLDQRASPTADDLLPWFDRYFCTKTAAGLADTIGQVAIESGDLALAESVYLRVLNHHPDRVAHQERYQAMLHLVAAFGGDTNLDPSANSTEVNIRWMGQDRLAGDVIAEVAEGFSALQNGISPNDWPIFAGDSERNRHPTSQVDELGLLWRFSGFSPTDSEEEEELDLEFSQGHSSRGRRLTIHPVVSSGLVVVQNSRQIVALHRNTGALAWRFRADHAGAGEIGFLDEQPPGWDSPTIHDGRVYASLPGDTVPYYGYESASSPPELVCLDIETGRPVWRVDQRMIEEEFAEVTFDSTPLVRHDSLFVVARRRRSFGFEDCYLYRFNANTGAMEYRTHLGSSSTGSFGARQPTMAIAAMHGDTVYVCTNLGTVAAISAQSGAVKWLRMYPRNQPETAPGSERFAGHLNPWQFNPITWSKGRIIFLPTDAARLTVLRADNGSELHSIPVDQIGGLQTILGVSGELLCGVGREAVCYDLAKQTLKWSAALPENSNVYGRGVWVDDRLLIPTRKHIYTFQVADGQRTQSPWDAQGEGGNLLAMPEQVLVSGVGRISAYVPKARIWETLRGRMNQAPLDPLPALELAEVALSNGEFNEAVRVLDEAVRRMESQSQPLEPSLGRRLFHDVLIFVERLTETSALNPATLDKLFAYASRHAPDTAAHLNYRFLFAAPFEQLGQPERSIRLYHQILRDRSLRELPADANATRSITGGVLAQTRIAALITEYGRSIYAPYEVEALQWLENGRAAGDETTLRRVAETFPNSSAAPKALIAHGELLIDNHRFEQAARRFAKVYHCYPKKVDRPTLLRKIADAYESAGKPEHSYRWLTKAIREHPSVVFEHQGRQVSFRTYREHLAHIRANVEPSRPNLVLPLNETFAREFANGVTLLTPWFADDPSSRWSRYYVYTPAGIRAFGSRDHKELWPAPAPVRIKAQLLIARADLAVFATMYEVFALDPTSGERRWSLGTYPRGLADELGDWEDQEAFRTHALYQGRLVSVRDGGRMECIALDIGELLWSQIHRPESVGEVRLSEERVVYHIVQDDRTVVCLLDAETGAWLGATMTDQKRTVQDLFVTLDGQVIVVTSQSISSYAPETSRRNWRVATHGHVRRNSLIKDVDALYFSSDGHRIRKISLEDGKLAWESERLVPRGDDDLSAKLSDNSVIISSESSVGAIDAVTGLTLWRGATPESPRFNNRLLTRSYTIAVDVPGGVADRDCVAYFYDQRNASGLIPRNGGAPNLGKLDEIRTIMAADGTLLVQTGTTIKSWTHK